MANSVDPDKTPLLGALGLHKCVILSDAFVYEILEHFYNKIKVKMDCLWQYHENRRLGLIESLHMQHSS